MGLMSTRTSGGHASSGLATGGQTDSLWGLRGAEDLGGGWRANFSLSSGFDATSGQFSEPGVPFNYGAWLGLSSRRLGELRLGRQYTVGQAFGAALQLAGWKDMGMGATFKASDNYQNANAVNYYTPEWNGLQAGMGYSFSADGPGNAPTRDNNRAFGTGLKYEEGPWLAVLTYEQMRLADPGLTGGRRPAAVQAGFSYDFEGVKVSVAWSRQRNGYVGLDGGDPDGLGLGLGPARFARGGTVDAWLLGASIPMGRGDLLLQWSLARPDWSWTDGSDARNAQVASLGYVYNLSPRTSLYAFGACMTHYTIDEQFDPGNSRTTRVGMGVTHNF
jgi:predicted porin